jgi:AraC-like DNA-binding protein
MTGQTDEHRNLLTSNSATSGWILEQMAAAACLSAYYFARQFKRATGLAPNQYVRARRVERAKQLLQARAELPLAEVTVGAGFSDQSLLTHHFKRLVGVTPRQFRRSFGRQSDSSDLVPHKLNSVSRTNGT